MSLSPSQWCHLVPWFIVAVNCHLGDKPRGMCVEGRKTQPKYEMLHSMVSCSGWSKKERVSFPPSPPLPSSLLPGCEHLPYALPYAFRGRHREVPGSSQASSGEDKGAASDKMEGEEQHRCSSISTCMSLYMRTNTYICKYTHACIHHIHRHHTHTHLTQARVTHTSYVCMCDR